MKSFFLSTLVLTAITANVVSAQVTKPAPKQMTKQSAKPVVKEEAKKVEKVEEVTKSSYQKFSDRLKIGYFGVFTTPHLQDIKHNRWKNAATSPEFGNAPTGKQKNQDTWPTNFWNQISFNYNFGAKMNFVVNPRFMIPMASAPNMKKPEDRSFIMLDDVLVGFQGVVYSSADKKFNLWIRPGVRLPTSHASRNTGNAGTGRTTHQLDLTYSPTYDFNKTWQLGMFAQFRQWVIEDQYGTDRVRSITNPYIQYTLNDVSRVQLYYELILETDRRGKPENDREVVYTDRWQNVSFIYSRDITPKLNFSPLVGVFVNDTPITDKSVWAGAWISYQIK